MTQVNRYNKHESYSSLLSRGAPPRDLFSSPLPFPFLYTLHPWALVPLPYPSHWICIWDPFEGGFTIVANNWISPRALNLKIEFKAFKGGPSLSFVECSPNLAPARSSLPHSLMFLWQNPWKSTSHWSNHPSVSHLSLSHPPHNQEPISTSHLAHLLITATGSPQTLL